MIVISFMQELFNFDNDKLINIRIYNYDTI